MLNNVKPVDELRGVARAKASDHHTKTVTPSACEEMLQEGWEIKKRNKRSIRLAKKKGQGLLLEDRVWTLLYRMGFQFLAGEGGARLRITPKDPESPTSLLDVVAIDEDVALAIECKSAASYSRRPQFQEELGKLNLARQRFAGAVAAQFPTLVKRQTALAFFCSKIQLSENDLKRARESNVAVFDDVDLAYYEELVAHLGPAAKYQFLADVLPGKPVPGLTLRVPAVRTKMAGINCYTFTVPPTYLLKIGFVSHRAKGRASDVDTYQRMIRRSRLNKIREYIDNDGIFPTNIVINLNQSPRFDQIEQEADQQGGKMGWLELRPAYKSAWIIDGQHRLFAYSGHPRAAKSTVAVLAFEKLPPSRQAELFIDINAQQKSVKNSLLQELYAELHWNATEPAVRVRAIVSKAIQSLDADFESPFHGRILAADDRRDSIRCITLTSLYRALDRSEFYIAATRKAGVVDYGPLWAGDENELTRKRTVRVLNYWFRSIRGYAEDWWDAGAGDGGGLAMNDGVAACVDVLRSVFIQMDANGLRFVHLEDEELLSSIEPYANALGDYLGSLSEDERKQFRDLRGVQGVTTRTRRCQQAIRDRIPEFGPPGLDEFMETEKAQTNLRAKSVVDRIEKLLQETILEELRREYGEEESGWWMEGIPSRVRKAAAALFEEDSGQRGGREFYFNLIDYREIIKDNWLVLGELFGYGSQNMSKDRRTAWIDNVNGVRKVVSHVSSGKTVSLEQLAQLEVYEDWLTGQVETGSDA